MNPVSIISRATAALVITAIILLPQNYCAEKPLAPDGAKPNPVEARALEIKGEFETAILVLPPFPSFPPGPFQPILHLLITATGHLSHFGKATAATTDQAVDLSVIPNKGTGRWVFQNTKGDALWTETDLSSTPLDANGSTQFGGTLTVLGGSGDFAGATGTLNFEGHAEGDIGFFTIEGTIWLPSDEEND